jgi:hypothetical protein
MRSEMPAYVPLFADSQEQGEWATDTQASNLASRLFAADLRDPRRPKPCAAAASFGHLPLTSGALLPHKSH